jgi:hypothetical protein
MMNSMQKIEELDDGSFEQVLQPIWQYLAVENDPVPSDVIFVFGGLDLAVPARAADLYLGGFAPHVLVTGSAGPYSRDVFTQPEACVFRDEMVKRGVPESSIITEIKATNALENVVFGMRALEVKDWPVNSAILVAKPFMMRRSMATFKKNYPNISVACCSPLGPILNFCDRSRRDFAERLPAELERLRAYAEKGDIEPQHVPESVKVAAESLKQLLARH